jgi:uncharacterized protein YwqG
LEDLLNAVSHRDLSITRETLNHELGPASKELADYLDRVWVVLPDDTPSEMNQETFDSIESPDLRWIVRCMFRRTPEGEYVGVADIVQREAKTGRAGGLDP